MKIDGKKILSVTGIVVASVVSTLISTAMQDREIENAVEKHFAIENNKEEA